MSKRKLSFREILMIVIMSLILIVTAYYLFFYFPHNANMYNINNKITAADNEINDSVAKIQDKKRMQEELEKIVNLPANMVTEIPLYDKSTNVLAMLNQILAGTHPNLNFNAPSFSDDGMVRNAISLAFQCKNYDEAKLVLQKLTSSIWRCQISNLNVSCEGNDVLNSPVSISMTITFFERMKIEETKPAEPSTLTDDAAAALAETAGE